MILLYIILTLGLLYLILNLYLLTPHGKRKAAEQDAKLQAHKTSIKCATPTCNNPKNKHYHWCYPCYQTWSKTPKGQAHIHAKWEQRNSISDVDFDLGFPGDDSHHFENLNP